MNAEVSFEQADVYEWLKSAIVRGERHDVVILDPAKQTRSQEGIDGAIAQFVAMNRLAMEVVSEGGILLTCSCSGLVTEGTDGMSEDSACVGRDGALPGWLGF